MWFTVWDSDGLCLLEMEGGNNYIWLAKEFEDEARVRLVEAAGTISVQSPSGATRLAFPVAVR